LRAVKALPCAIQLLLVISALVLVPVQTVAQEQIDNPQPTGSRYQRTVLSLQNSSAEMQADFASTALRALVEVYIAEADLARNQAESEKNNVKLLGWSRAVDQYARQLALVLDDIELGLPVELQPNDAESVTVMAGGRSVIMSHPRVDQQASFEQRVLLDFCRRQDCQLLTAGSAEASPIPVSASGVDPVWTFAETGPVCSYKDIELRFANARHLARWRMTCRQLLQELMMLADEIAWQGRHGVVVDWNELTVRPTPQRPEHLVLLNGKGDSLLATIPLIYGSPALLADITPWLKARVTRGQSVPVQLEAERYGWESVER
jgi:hypothetical protein